MRSTASSRTLSGGSSGDQADAEFFRQTGADGERALQRLAQREFLGRVHAHLAGLDLGEVEDVVDDAEQIAPAGMDVAGIGEIARILHRPQMLVLHHFGKAHDGVQRRAQLMAHIGEEGGLGAVGVLGLLHRDGQPARHLPHVGAGGFQLGDHVAGVEDDGRGNQRHLDDDVEHGDGLHRQAFGGPHQEVQDRDGGDGHGGEGGGGSQAAQMGQPAIQAVERAADTVPNGDLRTPVVHPDPPLTRFQGCHERVAVWFRARGDLAARF